VRQKCQISNPHISPKWGPIPPKQNHFSRVTRAIRCKGQVGVWAPKRGKPTPQFSTPIFSKTLRQISPKSLLKAKGYLKCVNLYFGTDLTTRFSGKLPTVLGGIRVWGQNPTRQPGIRPPVFISPRRRRHRPARAATGQGHVAGQRGPFGRRHGGQKRYFRFDRAGSSILCNSLAE